MNKYFIKAFSLIELMVVISIVGVLAAVAIPSYKAYIVRTTVSADVSIGLNLMESLVTAYESTGSWPTSVTVAGTTIVGGTHWQAVNSNNLGLQGLNYMPGTTGAELQLMFNNLTGIPGFSASGYNPAGAGYSSYCVGAWDTGTNGVKTVCGQSPYVNQDIPFMYLPTNCSCAGVDNFSSSGTGC